jgi:putative sigma-54 modulation protein
MQLTISGHHVDVTEALKDYVTNKLSRLEKHHDRITNTHVILTVEKLQQKAEATLHISGADLYADSESEDLYAAIDALTHKLDRQLIKHKEKHRNH